MRSNTTCLLALLAAGCAPFDLPVPPSLDELRASYDSPTAELTEASSADIFDAYVRKREELSSVADLGDLTSAIREFDGSVSVDGGDGVKREVRIDGIPIDADAEVVVEHQCDTGDILLTAVVQGSTIREVVWGTLNDCAVEEPVAVRVTGDVDTQIVGLGDEIHDILVRFSLSEVAFDGMERGPIDGDFRVEGDDIEFLVGLDEVGTIAAGGALDGSVVRARAANGTFHCNLEERQCEAESPPRQFSY